MINIQDFALNASLSICPSHIVEPLHLKKWWRERGVGELEKYFCTGKKVKYDDEINWNKKQYEQNLRNLKRLQRIYKEVAHIPAIGLATLVALPGAPQERRQAVEEWGGIPHTRTPQPMEGMP